MCWAVWGQGSRVAHACAASACAESVWGPLGRGAGLGPAPSPRADLARCVQRQPVCSRVPGSPALLCTKPGTAAGRAVCTRVAWLDRGSLAPQLRAATQQREPPPASQGNTGKFSKRGLHPRCTLLRRLPGQARLGCGRCGASARRRRCGRDRCPAAYSQPPPPPQTSPQLHQQQGRRAGTRLPPSLPHPNKTPGDAARAARSIPPQSAGAHPRPSRSHSQPLLRA